MWPILNLVLCWFLYCTHLASSSSNSVSLFRKIFHMQFTPAMASDPFFFFVTKFTWRLLPRNQTTYYHPYYYSYSFCQSLTPEYFQHLSAISATKYAIHFDSLSISHHFVVNSLKGCLMSSNRNPWLFYCAQFSFLRMPVYELNYSRLYYWQLRVLVIQVD